MPINEAMLAKALLGYLNEHADEFTKFLEDRCNFDLVPVTCRGDRANKQILLTLKRLGSDQSIIAENEFALRLERTDRRRRQ